MVGIIAYDRLQERFFDELVDEQQVSGVTLITAGSPLSHVYQHYFPQHYPALNRSEKVTWLNLYRIDDYVGTRIDGPDGFPVNVPLPLGGHTKYWDVALKRTEAFDVISAAKIQGLDVLLE